MSCDRAGPTAEGNEATITDACVVRHQRILMHRHGESQFEVNDFGWNLLTSTSGRSLAEK